MKPSFILLFFLSVTLWAAPATAQERRPLIQGISHMCLYSADQKATDDFYSRILGAAKAPDAEKTAGTRYYFSGTQYVEILPLPPDHGISRLACVGFYTADVAALRTYLQSRGVTNLGEIQSGADGNRMFRTKDPEGNVVEFAQAGGGGFAIPSGTAPISSRIIHVGFLVHNRGLEDGFYRQILGFKPYWFGAKQDDRVDWVSQQVPDGHDWLEYMLVGDGSDTPLAKVDARQLGVLNHFSLAVQNMEQAVTTLYANDRLSPRHDGPQMGKDGKWQANFYDPDGTRVELMEYKPAMKPCCSPFTADHPAP